MANYTAIQPKDHFNTLLYAGASGAFVAHTGVGFQPDFTWHKSRTGTGWHGLSDSVRGVDADPGCKAVYANDTEVEQTSTTEYLDGYQSDGFKTGENGSYGANANNYFAQCWKGSNATAVSNTSGTLTSSVSANTTSGFSICKYTGATGAQTFGHGIGLVPRFIMVKCLDSAEHWRVYHGSLGPSKYLRLNDTIAQQADSGPFSNITPTTTLVYVGGDDGTSKNGEDHIAYCFAEVQGFSKFGEYEGNGNADGTFVYTGFQPALVIVKNADGANAWEMRDNKRPGYNLTTGTSYPDATSAEGTGVGIALYSNGFKCRASGAGQNGSGSTYIYAAWAKFPMVSSNNIPSTAAY